MIGFEIIFIIERASKQGQVGGRLLLRVVIVPRSSDAERRSRWLQLEQRRGPERERVRGREREHEYESKKEQEGWQGQGQQEVRPCD